VGNQSAISVRLVFVYDLWVCCCRVLLACVMFLCVVGVCVSVACCREGEEEDQSAVGKVCTYMHMKEGPIYAHEGGPHIKTSQQSVKYVKCRSKEDQSAVGKVCTYRLPHMCT